MWIYYSCTYGPGHQGCDDGFEYFADDWTEEAIQNHFDDMFYDYDNCIIRWRAVDAPPTPFLEDEIEATKSKIEGLQSYLETLEKEDTFAFEQENRADEELQNAMRGKFLFSMIENLHKERIMVTSADLSNWRWGKKAPDSFDRERVISIIKQSDSYPQIAKDGRVEKRKRSEDVNV